VLPVKREVDGVASIVMKNWSSIREKIYYVNNNGWLMFDNVFMTEHGLNGILTDDHLWKWKTLKPCFSKHLPNYCYLDVISGSYEYIGLPGFGLLESHGHCFLEMASPDEGLISIGQWPDPYRGDDRLWKNWIYGSCKPVLMCPDPYTIFRGEKVVHRYYLGRGTEGTANIEKIKAKIMQINNKFTLLHTIL